MRENPDYALVDRRAVRRLVRETGWMTLVSATRTRGLVVSHYPVVLADERDDEDLTLLSHVGRPDEEAHGLGDHEVVAIIEGPSGYVSPGWYPADVPAVPTWNFTVAHLHGTPELLDHAENLRTLEDLVDRFESRLPAPRRMRDTATDSAYADRISAGTVGFRLPVTRFEAKRKLSQDKPAETVARVISALEEPGPYRNPALAADMRREHGP